MRRTPISRQEALAIEAKRIEKATRGDEAHLQADIVRDFNNKFPEKRGALIGTFQNMTNAKTGANMVSLGLIKGVSDLLLFQEGKCIGIEVKHPELRHNAKHCYEQALWIKNNCHRGGFCSHLSMFWDIVSGKTNGIPPEKVIKVYEQGAKTIRFKDLE